MRRPLTLAAVGMELYALLFAALQGLGGVRTDEAKYLLDIPYPHPPLLRGLMHATEVLPFQEFFWRVLLASLFVQAAWLVRDMARDLPHAHRTALMAAWLLSGGVMLWAGSIMVAPVNALQGLVLVWLLSRPEYVRRWPAAVSLFWMASLLSGYQAVLYLPVAAAVFLRAGVPFWRSAFYVAGPVGALLLATLANPFAVASLVHHGGEQLHVTAQYRVFHTGRLWLIGGSLVATLMGTFGLLRSRRWEFVASFACVAAFVLLNWFEYYSVLFTPLLIAGLAVFFRVRRVVPEAFCALLLAGAVVTVTQWPLTLSGSPARQVMRAVQHAGAHGPVLVSGRFGHEWQYESRLTILRYAPERVDAAGAVVCLVECEGWEPDARWMPVPGLPVRAWVRR